MSALSHANNWSVALELFNAVHEDPKVLEQLQVLEGGLAALTTALSKAGAVVQMLTVVHFMLENQIKVRLCCGLSGFWICWLGTNGWIYGEGEGRFPCVQYKGEFLQRQRKPVCIRCTFASFTLWSHLVSFSLMIVSYSQLWKALIRRRTTKVSISFFTRYVEIVLSLTHIWSAISPDCLV